MGKHDRTYRSFLEDSLEYGEDQSPIENAVEGRPDPSARRKYFREGLFPYRERLGLREYYEEKLKLQIELVRLQAWVRSTGQRLVVVFEGRDAAGKGSTIKRFTEYLNPRGARVVALDKPSEVERGEWYFQRYVRHLPSAGDIVFFDRSWYNRAGVEHVMGFCTSEEYEEFFRQVPDFERMLVRSGTHLVKLYFSVGRAEQAKRFHERKTSPLKRWKFSPMDEESQLRWKDYTKAKDAMLRRTHSSGAPWTIIKSEDKLRARLEAMRFLLHSMPYEPKDPKAVGVPDPLLVASANEIYED